MTSAESYEESSDELEPASGSERTKPGLAKTVWRSLVVLMVLGSFAIWIYAYSGAADRDTPDLLTYRAFPESAEVVCATALEDLEALPNAIDAVDGEDRATQIVASTERLELMLDELDTLVGGDARDLEISRGWLADWRVLIGDRYNYAERIAADTQQQFLISDLGVAERLDKRLTRVANTNSMPSCAAPGDV